MRSLRTTLILGTTIGIALVLLGAGALLYMLVRSGLVNQFDHALIEKAKLLASMVEQESGKTELDFDELDMGEFERPEGSGYLQLWLADGSTLYRSVSLGGGDMERMANAPTGLPLFRWVTLPSGRTGRAVELTLQPRSDAHGGDGGGPVRQSDAKAITVVMARDAGSVEATLSSLKAVLVGVGLAALAISSGVLWLAIRRGLAPLKEVAEEITQLGDQDLSKRIHASAAPDELQPIVNRLNDLLGRLESAFRRERSFSADVAHELRTPLAGLRSTMEVALSRTRQPAEYEEAMGDCLRTTLRMQAVVESLLSLTRLESGQVEVELESVVPDDLVRSAWQPLQEEAKKRRLQVQWTQGAGQAIRTDPTLLRLVVGNIMENAVLYANEGGRMEIEITRDHDVARIRVANSGSRISQDQTEMVFERFWRGDAARSAAGVRCGLGLSLVRKAASVLGGSVGVKSSVGGRFEIAVSIPSLQTRSGT